jgi:hypothetical protein
MKNDTQDKCDLLVEEFNQILDNPTKEQYLKIIEKTVGFEQVVDLIYNSLEYMSLEEIEEMLVELRKEESDNR